MRYHPWNGYGKIPVRLQPLGLKPAFLLAWVLQWRVFHTLPTFPDLCKMAGSLAPNPRVFSPLNNPLTN
jgi:hypothetical protein